LPANYLTHKIRTPKAKHNYNPEIPRQPYKKTTDMQKLKQMKLPVKPGFTLSPLTREATAYSCWGLHGMTTKY